MKVFILSLLAVSSVNSHAIGYPHHSQLLAYSPARGEFPVYNEVAQGYLRYFDSNGAERQVGYSYPEPLYGLRRFSYISGSNGNNQFVRTSSGGEPGFTAASYYQMQDNADLIKAREEHFRRWCEQRYQALKTEMDKLRAEGLKPSNDMMAQMKPLEKIIGSTSYTGIAELPEIKRIRDEHLRIWNEARLKVLQQEENHLRFHRPQESSTTVLKSSFISSSSDANPIIGETAEQKKAREEHLRIYNEQLQKVKHLEKERLQQTKSKSEAEITETSYTPTQFPQRASFEWKSSLQQQGQQQQQQLQYEQSGQVTETPEVMRAREEHLRLVNEAKIRAQSEGTLNKAEATGLKNQFNQFQQTTGTELKSGFYQGQQEVQQQQQQQQVQFDQAGQVVETPEVMRAREEHLRLVNEAKLKAQAQGTYNKAETSGYRNQYNQFQQGSSFELKSGIQQGQQQTQAQAVQFDQTGQVMETPEVMRAREEHLRLVNEAKLKAQAEGTYNKAETSGYKDQYNQFQQGSSFELKSGIQQGQQQTQAQAVQFDQTGQVTETPEVMRAREEHLRLVNEAKLKAQAEGTYNKAETSGYKDQYNQFQQGSSFESKSGIQQGQQQTQAQAVQFDQTGQVMETPEVMRAREEHLRLVNEAKLKAQAEGTYNKAETSGYRDQYNKFQQGSSFELKSGIQQGQQKQAQAVQFDQTGQVMETPEVMRAREEHLRLVNELKAQAEGTYNKAETSGYKDQFNQFQQGSSFELKSGIQQGQQQTQAQAVQFHQTGQVMETPEVMLAREEHLRLVNEAKLKAQAEGTFNKAETQSSQGQYNQLQQGTSFELRSGLQQGQQQLQQQQQQVQLDQSGQVIETPEVMRAREEHLRLVNEAKLKAQAEGTFNPEDDGSYKPEKTETSPLLKFVPSVQQPIQPIQNIAILQTTQPLQQALVQQQESTFLKSGSTEFSQQQAQATAVQDTPEVIRAREEHLRLVNEAKLKTIQQSGKYNQIQETSKFETYNAKIDDAEKLRETERLREAERLVEAERIREAERMREEGKMREMERLREMERQKEEERMLEAERLRLKKEEEERLQTAQMSSSSIKSASQLSSQLKSSAAQRFESSSSSGSSGSSSSLTGGASIATGTGFVLSSQYQNNPYLVRFASQPGTTTYIVGEQQSVIGAKPSLLYLPSKTDSSGIINPQNPFLLRFSESAIKAGGLGSQQQQTSFQPIASLGKISTYSSSSGQLSSGSSSSSSSSIKFASSDQSVSSLSEIEKATRDHFRAHEIALEKLRLANTKNPQVKDC